MIQRLFSFALLLALSTSLWAQFAANDRSDPFTTDNDFLPVEQAYQLSIDADGSQGVFIFSAANSYYLYRHGFKLEWVVDGQTRSATLQLPEGIKKDDEYFGAVEVYYQQVIASATLPDFKQQLQVKVSSQGCADAGLCYPPYDVFFNYDADNKRFDAIELNHYRGASPSEVISVVIPENIAQSSTNIFLWALVAAFLGGLILNLMPCVLPVLSIKLIQLMQMDRSRAKAQALAYCAGVIISFVAIAALLIGLRSTGLAVGWGFQLQQPWFVASLVYLFFVLALSMAGFIALGQRFMGSGEKLTQGNNLRSAFFTGMLAVIVASPCTAPFMGSAVGFALAQSNLNALLVFASLGLGMALPLTASAFIPMAHKLLPKPGLWMQRLKEFFAFPLFITAIWLLWVLNNQAGSTAVAFILLGCTGIFFALWCFKSRNSLVKAIGLSALIGSAILPFSSQLENTPKAYMGEHVVFNELTLSELRHQGTPVFIDLTADWCITCLANKKTTLETMEVQQAFKDAGIVYMVGDWTNFNPEITALLSKYQRSGIPLYLLFPPIADAPPVILPQLLNERIVLDAIKNNK